MKVVSVEDGFEPIFWNLVNKDPLNYYFFIFDWTRRREQTKILLAMEDERVSGSMLLFARTEEHSVVQLRGNREAVDLLLESVGSEKVELQAPLECEDIVLKKYKPSFRHVLVLMRLKKGEENIQIDHAPVKLGVEDTGEAVDLMRRSD